MLACTRVADRFSWLSNNVLNQNNTLQQMRSKYLFCIKYPRQLPHVLHDRLGNKMEGLLHKGMSL